VICDDRQARSEEKTNETLSASRINTIMQFLRSILGQEFRTGNIQRDPATPVKRKEVAKSDVDPLSAEELQLALATLEKNYRPLFAFLANTGCRPNEALALRWGDIDWNKKEASITKGRVRGFEGLPKTKAAIRKVPLNPDALSALNAAKKDSVRSIDEYIFTKSNGAPIDKHLDRIWTRALKKAGIKLRPSYQLRHTFATQCILNELPLPYIAKILGHTTIEPLVRHYTGWIDKLSEQRDDQLKSLKFH
jgi:integrase